MAPLPPSQLPRSTVRGRRRIHTRKRVRRVNRLVRSGSSNRQVTRATNRAVRSINLSQRRGSYGRRSKVATRRLIKTLNRDSSIYSKRSARRIRRARRPGAPDRRPNFNLGKGARHGGENVGRNSPWDSDNPIKRPKQRPNRGNLNRPRPGPPSRPKPQRERPKLKRNRHPRDPSPGPKKNKEPKKNKGKKDKQKNYKFGKSGKRLVRRATNITENRFYRANPNLIKKEVAEFRKARKRITKKVKNKEKEKRRINAARKNMMKDIRERGTGAGKLYRKAGLAVGAELDPQLKALKSRIKQERRNRRRAVQDLKGLYERADRQHTSNEERITNRGTEAVEDTRNAFERLKESIDSNYSGASQTVKDELARLNIGDVESAATEGLTRDQRYSLQQANLSQAESVSAQRENTQGFGQLMALLGGELSAQGLGARTAVQQKFLDEIMSLKDQKSALAATRLGKIVTAVEALKASNRSAKAEAIQNRIANQMARQQFGLDVAEFKSGRRLDVAKLRQNERENRREHRIDRLKYDLDRAKFFADQMGGGKGVKKRREYSNSRTGAIDYLRDRGAPNGMIDLYQRADQWADGMLAGKGFWGLPKRKDHKMLNLLFKQDSIRGLDPAVKKALRTALQIEWGLI